MSTLFSTKVLILCVAGTAVLASAGSVTAASLITSKQIKDGTIKMKDLSPAVRAAIAAPGPSGAQGPAGPEGPSGAQGEKGAKGESGTFSAASVTIVTGNQAEYPVPFPGGVVPSSDVVCPVNTVAIGGWFEMVGLYFAAPAPFVSSKRQAANPRMWSVTIQWPDSYDTTNGNPTYVAKAMCAGTP